LHRIADTAVGGATTGDCGFPPGLVQTALKTGTELVPARRETVGPNGPNTFLTGRTLAKRS